MQIQLHATPGLDLSRDLGHWVEQRLAATLDRFAPRMTRVAVHLTDHNGPKHGAHDKRCLLEARIAGRPPVAVSHEAPTVQRAVEGAIGRLERALAHVLARQFAQH
jgi:hypothetical protein